LIRKSVIIAVITVLSILVIDQAVKFSVKLNMWESQETTVINHFFYIHFTENPGMAFGMQLGGENGKLLLSLFRIVAISGIGYLLFYCIKRQYHIGLIFSMALIFAGAVGNMIDCAFYGLIFSGSEHQVASLFPAGGGYGKFMYGQVVDMLYFPMVNTTIPSWSPYRPNEPFTFFDAIFNIADASISVGVGIIFVFQGRFFKKEVVPATVGAEPENNVNVSEAAGGQEA
jgi:signal peptidase II